jgi:hypothetical protein
VLTVASYEIVTRLTARDHSALADCQRGRRAGHERLHKYMLELGRADYISDETRAVIESEWPEVVHKLPPKDTPR